MIKSIPHKNSGNHLKSLLFMLILVCISAAYTLDGQWSLNPQQLQCTQSNPKVAFKFVNKIVIPALAYSQDILDGESTLPPKPTNQQLTIYACKTLTYNYFVDEKNIYFMPVTISSENRACLPNQVEQIKRKVESAFYFDIVFDKLILYDASQTPSLVLTRADSQKFDFSETSYVQQWSFVKLNGINLNKDANESDIFIGEKTIDVCDFKGDFTYTSNRMNNIQTKLGNNGCLNKNVTEVINKMSFYLIRGRLLYLYDKNLKQIGILEFKKVFNSSSYQQLKTGFMDKRNKVKEDEKTGNNAINETLQPSVPAINKEDKGNQTSIKPQLNQKEINNKENKSTPQQPSNVPSNITPQQPSNVPSNITPQQASVPIMNPKKPQSSLNQSSSNPSDIYRSFISNQTYLPFNYTDCKCEPMASLDYLQPFNKSSIWTKWYLYSIYGSDKQISQFYKYSLIVRPQSIIFYGECFVKFSRYNLINNELIDINPTSFRKAECQQQAMDKTILDPFFNKAKYVNYQHIANIPYLFFYDQQFKHVATFNTLPPNFPPEE